MHNEYINYIIYEKAISATGEWERWGGEKKIGSSGQWGKRERHVAIIKGQTKKASLIKCHLSKAP